MVSIPNHSANGKAGPTGHHPSGRGARRRPIPRPMHLPVGDADMDNLRESGITRATARANGLRTADRSDEQFVRLGFGRYGNVARGGLLFPYYDLNGNDTGFARLRSHFSRTAKGRNGGRKEVKYEQPVGQPNRAYFPAGSRDALLNPAAWVYITEGEKKALALSQLGLGAVGLSGVYGWKVKGKAELIPDLAAVPWAERAVYVVFDYDAKPDTRRYTAEAARQLATRLRREGAREVYAVALPPGPHGDKQGVDDFLVAAATRGENLLQAFQALVAEARPVQATAGFGNCRTAQVPGPDGKPRPVRQALTVTQIADWLYRLTDGWPRRTGKLLFAPDGYEVLRLETPEALLAWVGGRLAQPIRWSGGEDTVSARTFFTYLQQTAENYEAVEPLPHHPPLPGHYYLHPAPAGGDGTALAGLLDRLQPATPADRALVHAAFLTVLWGGKPGTRPAFLIESDGEGDGGGRGAGKSTLAKLISRLVGGHIDFRPEEDFGNVMRRLLSPAALALLVNVKRPRFSWDDLEGLITNDTISGHRMYQGEGQRPNTLTWFITLNNASLSKDLAQRCVIVRVRRPRYDGDWQGEVERYIDDNRWAVVGDLLAQLAGPKAALARPSRWATWEQEVLACVADPDGCQRVIADRQGAVDGDQEDADQVREAFAAALRLRGHDPETAVVFIPSRDAAEIVNQATGESRPVQRASAYLQTLAVPQLRKSNWDGGARGWRWTGRQAAGRKAVPLASPAPQLRRLAQRMQAARAAGNGSNAGSNG